MTINHTMGEICIQAGFLDASHVGARFVYDGTVFIPMGAWFDRAQVDVRDKRRRAQSSTTHLTERTLN